MKRLIVVVAVVAIFAAASFSSCGGGSASLKNEQDSIAYAIGLDLGASIKQFDEDLNVDIIAAAMKDVLKDSPKMEREDAMEFMREVFTVRKPARAKVAAEEFLAKVEKENKNIIKTESGLMYEIIEGGDQAVKATKDEDVVRVTYEGKLKDGTIFDSTQERGDTAEFPLNRVIRGWTEGMKLVGKGGQIKLWVPAELGYGEQGGGQIGPNEPLIFEVTVVDVIPAEDKE